MVKKLHTTLKNDDNPFQVLYEWEAPERYWTMKDRAWYVYYSLFFILIIALCALLQEYLLIIAVIAFIFLWFIQASTPPHRSKHTVTTLGIRSFGKMFKWKDMAHFWFTKKNNLTYLHLDLRQKDEEVKRFSLIMEEENADKIMFGILIKYVDYGDLNEIGYGMFSKNLYGQYMDISSFLGESSNKDI